MKENGDLCTRILFIGLSLKPLTKLSFLSQKQKDQFVMHHGRSSQGAGSFHILNYYIYFFYVFWSRKIDLCIKNYMISGDNLMYCFKSFNFDLRKKKNIKKDSFLVAMNFLIKK